MDAPSKSSCNPFAETPRLKAGRESHTASLPEFDRYMYRLLSLKRVDYSLPSTGAYNDDFWKYIRRVLEQAGPVGYSELPDPKAFRPVGSGQCRAFQDKVRSIADLTPLHPAHLAERSGVDHRTVLEELLYASSVGLVQLVFAPECRRCGCAVLHENRISNLPSEADCEVCGKRNQIDSLDDIMVAFLLSQDVLYLPTNHPFGCRVSRRLRRAVSLLLPVPPTFTGSGFRHSVGRNDDNDGRPGMMIRPALECGRYRVLCPYSRTDFTLQVGKEDDYQKVDGGSYPVDDACVLQLRVSEVTGTGPAAGEKYRDGDSTAKIERTVRFPHGRIHFDIIPDTGSFFFLTLFPDDMDDDAIFTMPQSERVRSTTATQVLHHRTFQHLFANDKSINDFPRMPLSITNTTLVVMQLGQVAELCHSLGDGPTLNIVKEYFDVISRAFSTHGGRVMKAMGDSIHASFATGREAIEATAEAMMQAKNICTMRKSSSGQDWHIHVRAGIHCGSTLMVSYHGINECFGRTLNEAMSAKDAARSGECLVTDSVLMLEPDSMSAFRDLLVSSPTTAASAKTADALFEASRDCNVSIVSSPELIRASGFCLKDNDAIQKKGRVPFLQRIKHDLGMEQTPAPERCNSPVSSPNRRENLRSGGSMKFFLSLAAEQGLTNRHRMQNPAA